MNSKINVSSLFTLHLRLYCARPLALLTVNKNNYITYSKKKSLESGKDVRHSGKYILGIALAEMLRRAKKGLSVWVVPVPPGYLKASYRNPSPEFIIFSSLDTFLGTATSTVPSKTGNFQPCSVAGPRSNGSSGLQGCMHCWRLRSGSISNAVKGDFGVDESLLTVKLWREGFSFFCLKRTLNELSSVRFCWRGTQNSAGSRPLLVLESDDGTSQTRAHGFCTVLAAHDPSSIFKRGVTAAATAHLATGNLRSHFWLDQCLQHWSCATRARAFQSQGWKWTRH